MVPNSPAMREYLGESSQAIVEKPTKLEECREIPEGFRPLRNSIDAVPFLIYLRQRGVTSDQVKLYRMGYATEGSLRNHVIIPSFDSKGDVNLYVARAIYGKGYVFPDATKDVVFNEYMVDWTSPVCLVEGVFDAIAVGPQGVPLLGKFLLPRLTMKLLRCPLVYVCLDSDAKREAKDLAKQLTSYGVKTALVSIPGKDPSEVGHDKFWSSVSSASGVLPTQQLLWGIR